VGRAEDFELKGLDIAASAMGRVVSSGIAFEHPPELIVRGAPKGAGAALRATLQRVAACDLAVRVREYTDEVEAIESDILRSRVMLMPSRSEGFGLVAFEALGRGIPILVSDKSGAGELLRERLGAYEAQNFVVTTADDLQTAAAAWAKAIEFVLLDPRAAFSRAAAASQTLADKHSWDLAAVELIKAIGSAREPRIGIEFAG
jgi:glycosyltransferase involved in cell wall biosynthesis